jgi:hypothetical protein
MSTPKFSNGVDIKGNYLPAPASLEELGAALLQSSEAPVLGEDYQSNADLELTDDVDTQDLANTGWGVIFVEGADPAVREALAPLLRLRERQANRIFEGYQELRVPPAGRRGQSHGDFLGQLKIGADGLADPSQLPYYLLLVGGPEEIDFDSQYEMDVARAVGRIHFDTPDEYARYAESVVAAEQRRSARRATLFGVQNGNERNTRLLLDRLVREVADKLEAKHLDWTIERVLGPDASKGRLEQILREPPSVLFTAGHGLCFPNDDTRQGSEQGAVVCSDWTGEGPVLPDFYYSAGDVGSGADLAGTIVFQFACFSAATPAHNDFQKLIKDDLWAPPDRPFVAGLPKRLLSPPGGHGALAVIGHVDRIWLCSFLNEETDVAEYLVFEQLLSRLLKGYRVGYAVEHLNRWHADCAIRLANLLTRRSRGEAIDGQRLARTWLVNNDARNYVLLGDPAVRLRGGEGA